MLEAQDDDDRPFHRPSSVSEPVAMQPILSDLADKTPRNTQHDMLARLYREIGISAVAAALEVSAEALEQQPSPKAKRETLVKRAA
jgi:hypothetical protein